MNVYPVLDLAKNYLKIFRGGNSVAFEDYLHAGHGTPSAYVSGNTVVVQYSNGCREEYYFNDDGFYEGHQFIG